MSLTLGFIGGGMIGSAVARLAVAAGLDVVVSNSRGPESLSGLVAELGGGARAVTVVEAARLGDVVVAAVPLKAFGRLPVDALVGRTVLDTANYYPERDGYVSELDIGELTSSALLQRHLVGSRVVKAFNTMTPHQIGSLARHAGAVDRCALPVAGDDVDGKGEAVRLLDVLGFDAVDVGSLAESWRTEPGTPAYVLPYLGEVPVLNTEEFFAWTQATPGIAVAAGEVAKLVASAVRQVAGAARIPDDA